MNTNHKEIEDLLKNDARYDIRQTFGFPFQDFGIFPMGMVFTSLLEKDGQIPGLEYYYHHFINHPDKEIKGGGVEITDEMIKGRVARAWASFIREWHAYYILLETGRESYLSSDEIIRTQELDTKQGIDVYLKNVVNRDKSIKLNIFQDTKNSKKFREIKDTRRVKGQNIPGKTYDIPLGKDNPDTTKSINNWFLLSENYARRITTYFANNYNEAEEHPLQSSIIENFSGVKL